MKSTEYLILLGTEPAEVGDQIAGLRPDQIAGFTPDQIAGFTPDQTAGLTPYQIAWFTPDQIAGLTPRQIAGFTPDQTAGFTPRQIAGFTPRQIAWFTPDQTAGFQAQQARVPSISKPYTRLVQATQACSVNFDMSAWHHTSKTTHCAAGWMVVLAGKEGARLEEEFGTPTAARLILRKSCPPGWPLPNFYATNEAAAAFINHMAAREAEIT